MLLTGPGTRSGFLLRLILRTAAVLFVALLCIKAPVFYFYTFDTTGAGAQKLTLAAGFVACCIAAPLLPPSMLHKREELPLRLGELAFRTTAVAALFAEAMARTGIKSVSILLNLLLCAAFHIILTAALFLSRKPKGKRRPYLRPLLLCLLAAAVTATAVQPELAAGLSETVCETPFVIMAAALAAILFPALLREYSVPEEASQCVRRLTPLLYEIVFGAAVCAVCITDGRLVRLLWPYCRSGAALLYVLAAVFLLLLCMYNNESAQYNVSLQSVAAACFLMPEAAAESGTGIAYIVIIVTVAALISILYALIRLKKKRQKNPAE